MFLKQGSKGADVKKVQDELFRLGFMKTMITGNFGPGTEKAVIEFQKAKGLNADGIVGPITLGALGISFDSLIFPAKVPNGLREIQAMFGDPLLSGYWQDYGEFCITPPELDHVFHSQWNGKNGFWCNKLLVIHFQNVYKRIVERGLSQELKTYDGCYCIRKVRGREELSTHSWGIAIDHNAGTNPLGSNGDMNAEVVACFEEEGFTWGGRWIRKDCQHFQFAKGY